MEGGPHSLGVAAVPDASLPTYDLLPGCIITGGGGVEGEYQGRRRRPSLFGVRLVRDSVPGPAIHGIRLQGSGAQDMDAGI